MTENPQQQTPNSEMAYLTCTDYVIHPEQIQPKLSVPEQDVPELSVPEQTVPEQYVPEQVIIDQSPTTNSTLEPEIATNDHPHPLT